MFKLIVIINIETNIQLNPRICKF